MENENDQIEDVSAEEQLPDEETAQEEAEEKPKLTLEQQRGILQRKLTKINKELGVSEEQPKPHKTETKSGELDYAQLAYLEVKGITEDEQIEFVEKVMKKSGDDLKTVLKDDFVINRLKSIKENKTVKEAIPSSSKRSAPSARDTVDFWLNKPFEEVPAEFKREVLNKKLDKEKQASKFSDTPVVSPF